MHVRNALTLSVLAIVLSTGAALAGPVTIPNASFESPVVADAPPYATDAMDSWQKTPAPDWWTAPTSQGGLGYSADQWYQGVGTFLNYGGVIDNVDGNQAAFLFAVPGLGIYQDLAATYQVGQSYHLAVGLEGGGYGMAVGVPVSILLYYRDNTGQMAPVGSATYLNDNTSNPLTHLTDCLLDIPAVKAGDAWAGKSIGVEILATNGFDAMNGYWDLDNVRLTAAGAAPQPHPGDANNDGAVDVVDLGILATNYDKTGLPTSAVDPFGAGSWKLADFNNDGNVDVVDLGILATNYDWTGAPAQAVPEPAPAALLLAGAGMLIRRRLGRGG